MQGKGKSLRLSLMALVVVLIFGALGGLTLARDAFDADYDDCPAVTRLDSVGGLAIDRTDEPKEIRVSWDALDSTTLGRLGPNGYKARLTVIVEGQSARNVALGDTSLVVDDIDFTKELTVSVAVTLGDYVISDISEADFTSGMPAPNFKTKIYVSANEVVDDVVEDVNAPDIVAMEATDDDKPLVGADRAVIVKGHFYYLGFNDLFDNWFVSAPPTDAAVEVRTRPRTPKFRVGLAHGDGDLTPGDADFENYRITIEDSSGDLLGYQAETVEFGRTYGSNKIVFGQGAVLDGLLDNADTVVDATVIASVKDLSNIRLSNLVTDGNAVSPYYSRTLGLENPAGANLSYGNAGLVDADANLFPLLNVLYADAPVEYFDFPSDVFEADGSYTIRAWAEDGDGTRISPQASIKFSVQEREDIVGALYDGYIAAGEGGFGQRAWGTDPKLGLTLTVYGFSIQEE
jgi:hypothetical protein